MPELITRLQQCPPTHQLRHCTPAAHNRACLPPCLSHLPACPPARLPACVSSCLQTFLSTRYIAGVNMYFQGQAAAVLPISLTTSVQNFVAYFPSVSLIVTEYGASTDWYGDANQQAAGVADQAAAMALLMKRFPRCVYSCLWGASAHGVETQQGAGMADQAAAVALTMTLLIESCPRCVPPCTLSLWKGLHMYVMRCLVVFVRK